MNNNDILRRIRFAFDFSDPQAVKLFSLDPASSVAMTKDDFVRRLAKDEDPDFVACTDIELCAFLDGLIVHKRGLRDNAPPATAKPTNFHLTKNDILKKLRIALAYREEDMLETLAEGGTDMSKSELGALFRNPSHKHYRACGNQVLRNFIKGLTTRQRA
ncbi:DUF1456 domain-containing protein [Arenicella chitinivorans]|uniref:DUF1456 domain-containing protein n=1 Tax=Arenicella chitinivorans TaxID=1329800 RepID=A0A918VIW0_9GAMM|nr:DUF1456 family protein [Arenicella chitinivorans]GHA05130.1 DUF1456 domain-containing protein [Arenicella chitinivorans]